MINILVTGAGGGVGQGIIKSLKMIKDLDIRIITADMSALATGLYAGHKAYIVPACNSEKYLEKLEEIFEAEKINHYFPGTDVELEFCAIKKNYIEKTFNVNTIISNVDAVRIADDKYLTFNFLKNNNFYHPQTFLPEEIKFQKLEYPLIVKPAIGCRSIGVSIVKNESELNSRLNTEKGLIIQELVGTSDDEYTCTIVIVGKKVSEVMILKRVLRSGDTFRAEPIKSEKLSNYVTEIALKLNINGSCNFQLRIDRNGIPKVFEINCRFSGTTPFCSQLGLNPVEFYLKNFMNIDYEYNINYNNIVLRHWSEVIVNKENIEMLDKNKSVEPTIENISILF